MALTIYGKLIPIDKEYIENLTIRETWTIVTNSDNGQETDRAYFELGDNALVCAKEFLHVLKPRKYNQLREIMCFVKGREENEEKGFCIKIGEVQEIYELIKDIPNEWNEIFDENDRLKSQKAALVEQTAPYLIRTHYPYQNNSETWQMIDYSQWQTIQVIKFFELAARLKREVWLSY